MKIIPITNAVGEIIEREWLLRAEAVHRQLRPQLPVAYAARMAAIFGDGAEMVVACEQGAESVIGVAVFRVSESTFCGRELYCEDLITDEAARSRGVGHALMQYMETLARDRDCQWFTLDSGAQRQQAHKFYFREGMTISSFHFSKPLEKSAT